MGDIACREPSLLAHTWWLCIWYWRLLHKVRKMIEVAGRELP